MTATKVSKSVQYEEPGGFQAANQDFDKLAAGKSVKEHGNGIRSVEYSDGTSISVRPSSSAGVPTVQIDRPGLPKVKVRYK